MTSPNLGVYSGMNQNIITPEQAADLIFKSRGKIFNVGFYKKGDKQGKGRNDFREMRACLGSHVKKGLAGGPSVYDPNAHGLIWAYLMSGDENRCEDKNRRSISVDGIVELNLGGQTYRVSGGLHR